MCARAVGREVGLAKTGAQVKETVERVVGGVGEVGLLRGITRKSLGQVMKYRDEESREAFVRKAVEHAVSWASYRPMARVHLELNRLRNSIRPNWPSAQTL